MSRWRRDDGAAFVEMAIVLPLLLLVTFGIIDLGNALYVRVQVQEAAQEGAMYAIVNPTDPGGAIQRARESAPSLTPAPTVTVTCPTADQVAVTVVHNHGWIAGVVFGGAMTMTARVEGDVMSTTDTCTAG